MYRRTQLGSWGEEGDTPVFEIHESLDWILSRAGHVKSCLNLARPLAKAKYYQFTDSAQVP